ncbi:MAG TPA: response regulator transcription factor [Nevskia sp.]|nr:response regulator transcription factor [Nevskia sp.]
MPYLTAIVEDDPATREYLAAAVRGNSELELAAVAGSFAEARELLREPAFQVMLIDLGLPDGDGIELVRAATAHGVESMVVTVFADEQHVVSALEAGATGYLLKDSGQAEIGMAVVQLMQGGSPISATIARYLVRRLHKPRPAARPDCEPVALTEREHEVLNLIAKGYSYIEVGQGLGISPHTVTGHIKHLYRKLAVSTRGEAVFEAANQGLIHIGE